MSIEDLDQQLRDQAAVVAGERSAAAAPAQDDPDQQLRDQAAVVAGELGAAAAAAAEGKHCSTCICGKRAPVQREGYPGGKGHLHGKDLPQKGAGTVEWAEYLEGYAVYAARYGIGQSAERMAARGGFGYWELTDLLGHEPKTWQPRRHHGP